MNSGKALSISMEKQSTADAFRTPVASVRMLCVLCVASARSQFPVRTVNIKTSNKFALSIHSHICSPSCVDAWCMMRHSAGHIQNTQCNNIVESRQLSDRLQIEQIVKKSDYGTAYNAIWTVLAHFWLHPNTHTHYSRTNSCCSGLLTRGEKKGNAAESNGRTGQQNKPHSKVCDQQMIQHPKQNVSSFSIKIHRSFSSEMSIGRPSW